MTTPFRTSDGEPFFLLQDAELRHSFGSLIGQLAHSHWLDVAELKKFTTLLAEAAADPQGTRREALEDLFWGVLSSKEFLFNH